MSQERCSARSDIADMEAEELVGLDDDDVDDLSQMP